MKVEKFEDLEIWQEAETVTNIYGKTTGIEMFNVYSLWFSVKNHPQKQPQTLNPKP
jgi:hypothetical protein